MSEPSSVPAPVAAGEHADRLAVIVGSEAEVAALTARLNSPADRPSPVAGHCQGCPTCKPEWSAAAQTCGLSFDYLTRVMAEAEARVLVKMVNLARRPENRAQARARAREEAKAAERRRR